MNVAKLSSRVDKDWLMLAPLALAYCLHGAKTGITFLPVFILTGALFLISTRRWKAQSLPTSVLWPFALYLMWCWAGLLGGAPLDTFLFFYSRACLYILAGILIFQSAGDLTTKRFEALVMALGSIEAALIVIAKITGGNYQVGGLLQNSLHAGILLPCSFAIALMKIRWNGNWLGFGGRHSRMFLSGIHGSPMTAFGDDASGVPWIPAFAGMTMALALFFMHSRMGLILMAVIPVFLFPRKMMWILVGALAFAVLWLVLRGEGVLLDLRIDSLGLQGTMGRLGVWATGIDAIVAKPITGWGLGNFETAYLQFQHPGGYGLRYGQSTMFAHNGLLQVAAETGLPGTVLVLWGFVALLKRSIPLVSKERALFSIVIVFLVTSLVNYSLFLPFNGLVFTTAVALLSAKATSLRHTPSVIDLSKFRLLPTFMIGLLTVFLTSYGISEALQKNGKLKTAANVCPIRSDAWYELALQHMSKLEEALPYLNRALITNNQNSFYWQRKALVLIHLQPTEDDKIDFCFHQAQTLSPFHAPFYAQEGFYRLKIMQWERAKNLFEKAALLEPATTLPHYGLALLYEREGRERAARVEFELVRSLEKKKQELERDPVQGSSYRELFNSNYAQALFLVNQGQVQGRIN